jgi:hypothetical protein
LGCGVAARLCGIISSGSDDSFGYAFHIFENVTVPETQNSEALLFQPCFAFDISLVFRVLAAIRLDYQAMLEADEIDNIAVVDDLLSTPPQSVQSFFSQYIPKLALGIGRIGAHISGALFQQFMPGLNLRQSLLRRLPRRDPSPSHAFGAGPSLSRKGRGVLGRYNHVKSFPVG